MFGKITQKSIKNQKKIFEIPLVNTKKASIPFLQIGLRSLNTIPKEYLICYNYSNYKLKLKNWFYNNL